MGPDNIESINAITTLVQLCIQQGRNEEADKLLNQSLKYFKQDMYENHPTKT